MIFLKYEDFREEIVEVKYWVFGKILAYYVVPNLSQYEDLLEGDSRGQSSE